MLVELHRHLGDGERLAWHGRPGTARGGIELLALLALILAGGLVAKRLHAAGGPSEAASDFVELAVPCFIAGIVFWIWRVQRWCDLHFTIYGIADTRLLVVRSRRPAPDAKVEIPRPLVKPRRRLGSRATLRVFHHFRQVEDEDGKRHWTHDHTDLVDVRDADRAFALLRGI